MHRGEVWWADLGLPRGSAPALRRPVLIISGDPYNRSGLRTATVAVLTSNAKLAALPGNVAISTEFAEINADSSRERDPDCDDRPRGARGACHHAARLAHGSGRRWLAACLGTDAVEVAHIARWRRSDNRSRSLRGSRPRLALHRNPRVARPSRPRHGAPGCLMSSTSTTSRRAFPPWPTPRTVCVPSCLG